GARGGGVERQPGGVRAAWGGIWARSRPPPARWSRGGGGLRGATAARPLAHAALNPSPPLLQRAVGGGIRAMIPLQAALTARGCRSSHPPRARTASSLSAAALLGLLPVARRLSRKVSPT
ncbi:hypothetical protein ABZ686_31650, partial [Streptomyces sp. NPDC006992]